MGIEYENKFGYKKIGKYDFVRHEVLEAERFWMRNADKIVGLKTGNWRKGWNCNEWNGEGWEKMKGYYDCLFCKQKVKGVLKEDHLVHDKNGLLTCVSMTSKSEDPYTPCKHKFCERCGGKTEKDPWEEELKNGYGTCFHIKRAMSKKK